MVVVAGTLPIQPDKREEAVRMVAAVCAATRNEEGCISYDFAADLADPCLFRIFEQWESDEALNRHLQQPHTQAFLGAVGKVAAGAPDVSRYHIKRVTAL